MKVNEVMNKKVITCHPDEQVAGILNKLRLLKISGLPVVVKGKLVGLLSRTDIVNYLSIEPGEGGDAECVERYGATVKEIMITGVVTVDPSFTIEEAAKKMVEHDINLLPVVEGEKVVGIVTRGDIIKVLAESM
jgi:acetoin utilization protein AcuB